MNTNYEAIKSLISLLVKKSGYSLDTNYSEEELRKTKETLLNLSENKDSSLKKEERESLITNLKIRQANWENSAEIIGKDLLLKYNNNVSYDNVKERIRALVSIANKDLEKSKDTSLMSYLYERISYLEEKETVLDDKIKANDYIDEKEKELDNKLMSHMMNKVDSYKKDIDNIDYEIKKLDEVEEKDKSVVEKLKLYISSIKNDVESLEKVKKVSLNKGITIEIWEKLETIELEIKEKLDKANEIMKKSENTLEAATKKREEYDTSKKELEDKIKKSSSSISDLKSKLENYDYLDYTKKIVDVNERELVKIELKELNNKKDVLYVDANMVEKELIREWNKDKKTNVLYQAPVTNEEKKPKIKLEQEIISKDFVKEQPVVNIESVEKLENKKIDLDW